MPARNRTLLLVLAVVVAVGAALAAVTLVSRHQRLSAGQADPLPPTLAPRPPRPFGVNLHPWDYSSDERDSALNDIAGAGFGWIRLTVNWRDAGQQQALDDVLTAAAATGLHVIVALAEPSPAAPPAPLAFADVAGELAAAHAGQVAAWQVWDEPNLRAAWGDDADPTGYANLLALATPAIRRADADAVVLAAGLAQTTERGPANLSDIDYLAALYELGADAWFDAPAAKPYGFDSGPDERSLAPGLLHASRMVALRQVMVDAGDGDSLLWASHAGWNGLPPGWAGRPSIWGQTDPTTRAGWTTGLLDRAAREWPWAGVIILERYDTAGLAADDPRAGFALRDTPAWDALAGWLAAQRLVAGNHPADTPAARYSGDWQFSDLGADIPQDGAATIALDFSGTDLGVIARRDNYRAYLYVTIDGAPANALPRDDDGRAYAVLTSGDYQPHVETIWLARGLTPGPHTAVIEADRGWDQWAIAGFAVASPWRDPTWPWLPLGLGLLAVFAVVAAVRLAALGAAGKGVQAAFGRLSDGAQFGLALLVTGLFWAGAWLTWGLELSQVVRRYGDTLPLLVTLLTAGTFYFSPWLLLTLSSAALLLALLYLRPAFAVALITLTMPFYLQPRPLFERMFSVVEIVALMAAVVLALHLAARWREARFALRWPRWQFLDWAVAVFAGLSLLSIFTAEVRGVAITEFRTVVIEPVVLYVLLRTVRLDERDIWRAVDLWVLGGVVIAVIGLWEYTTGVDVITAEGGVMRLRSIYGSPNNVGLYLGRIIPMAAAVALLGGARWRRIGYGAASVLLLAAVVLSFSRGALLLGVPAALAVVFLFWQGRRAAVILAGAGVAGLLALIPLSQNPRFADLFNLTTGTSFFRINLWQSAIHMLRDHPLTGVGLDNFLYAYRGGYIRPAAWQDPNLSHAHNWVLDYGARLGVPGLLTGLGLMLGASWRGLQNTFERVQGPQRALAVGLLAALVNVMAHGLVDNSVWYIDLAFTFMFLLGAIQWLANEQS